MSNHRRKTLNRSRNKPEAMMIAGITVLIILLAVVILLVVPGLSDRAAGGETETPIAENTPTETEVLTGSTKPTEVEKSTAAVTATDEVVNSLEFPLYLQDNSLEIVSLFQYTGINPDCGNREGKNIAAIQIRNTAGFYLVEAKINLTLADGTQLNFVVENLPDGKSAMAFSTENKSIGVKDACVSATCEASFDSSAVAESDKVRVSVDGMSITLTNISGEPLSEIVVYCRSPLDEEYFGSIAYRYTVTDLRAHESATIDAWECILGIAEVVRITVK